MDMDHYFGDIPLNADKVLFAEDLIYWYLHNNWYSAAQSIDRGDISNKVDKYRQFIYNGFNEKIKMAVEFIDESLDCLVLRDYVSMKNEDNVNRDSFIQYAIRYYVLYFPEGFEACSFLIYCTRLADMAGYFYIHGIKDVLHLAVACIFKGFPEGDMFSGTWDTLNNTAEMFVRLEEDCNGELTPSDSSTDGSDISDGNYYSEDDSDYDPRETDGSDYSEDNSDSDSSETDESNEFKGLGNSSQRREEPNNGV